MINKETVFASAGTTSGSSSAGFTTGMVPGTVAKAEDVNMYMGISDQQLYAVCTEVKNLLTSSGIVIDPTNNTQLQTWASTKLQSAAFLTGIDAGSYTSAPTQNGNAITFPEMVIIYNKDVYYGKTASRLQRTVLPAQTLSATSAWGTGVYFIYTETSSGSTVSTLRYTQDLSLVSASLASTVCMLGSVYVINGAFQANSWKFQPWLQITSVDRRESPTAMTRGGFVAPKDTTVPAEKMMLQMTALEVMDEGINFEYAQNAPNIITFPAKSTYDYKFLYPGYDPSASALTTLDTTHAYNIANNTWDDISALAGKYVVMVPCIAPTGQTLMIPPMKDAGNWISDTMEEAVNKIYGLAYSLGNVAKRVIYLGQSLIVRVGATNLQDSLQFMTVGQLPQQLGGFTSASGQSGGSITTYRPMPMKDWNTSTSFVAQNNAANRVVNPGGNNNNISITLPSKQAQIVNQLEIYFIKNGGGDIDWQTPITWYTGVAPTFSTGNVYNIILENINNTWYGGLLGVGA